MQSKILSELQFCQMENESLRGNLNTRKQKLKDTRKEIYLLFNSNSVGTLPDESIVFTKENQHKILSMIDELIN
jgi:hypothetical protein